MAIVKKNKKEKHNAVSYVTATDARKDLFKIMDRVKDSSQPAYFTKSGTNMVLITEEEYESLIATIEVLEDSELMAAIKEGNEQIDRGEYITWEELKRKYSLE